MNVKEKKEMRKLYKLLFCMLMIVTMIPINEVDALVIEDDRKIEIKGTVIWEDDDNRYAERPSSVEVSLLANGVEVQRQIVTAPNWEYAFDITNEYLDHTEFTITQPSVLGYITKIVHPIVEHKEMNISNEWEKIAPNNELIIQHSANRIVASKMTKNRGVVIWTMDPLNHWVQDQIIESLEKNANGIGNPKHYDFIYGEGEKQKYGITVTSSTIIYDHHSDWSLLFLGTYNKGGIEVSNSSITNTYIPKEVVPETISIPVQKIWNDNNNQDGIRPTETMIGLYKEEIKLAELILNENNNWKGEFINLNKYENTVEIPYTIKEEMEIKGYTTHIDGYTITNTHIPETMQLEVSKEWNDNNNQDGMRPKEVIIQLYANEEVVESKTLNENNEWKIIITNLPKYANAKEIQYTIKEQEIDKYTTNIQKVADNKYVITNVYTPETISLLINKVWNDNNNYDKLRPESISVQLYKNNEVYGNLIELTKENQWKYTLQVDVYDNSQKVVWTVKEVNVPKGYTVTYDNLTIVNTHIAIVETSANNSIWIWSGLTIVSAVGIILLLRRKKEANNN